MASEDHQTTDRAVTPLLPRTGAGTLRREDAGRRVRLAAWVQRRRDLGGLQFFDLRDRSGVAQVVVRPEEDPEIADTLAPVRAEWVVEIEGEVVLRESPNPEMPTGAVEVIARRAVVLSRSEPVPFSLAGEPDASEETRLEYRYLDLRRADLQRNFILRDKVTLEVRQHFHEHGFVDVETPILTRSTPEGARDYLVPSRVHPGSFYALPQSPQIFKQLLMVAGLERYVQIARCFRDEDLRADRQPEFTQIDVEMSFNTEEDVFAVIEGLLRRIMPLVGIEVPEPLPRLTWAEAMLRYGSDRPDRRFGSEIVDLTERLGGSGFRGFAQAAAEGGVVRGFAVPGGAGASRRQVDEWAELARRHGAAGA
ncbi:MAG TPA: aspartate--tRNA ligase, partial [Thermoanaerobaculia bacterium]|nr:aspartate--tRNA ligase [Thermoanaerobaculia bacterium]